MNKLTHFHSDSLLVANQFYDDKSECALQFARVASIPGPLMAALKTEFLIRINYRLVVTPSEVQSYADQLQGRFCSYSFTSLGMWIGVLYIPTPLPEPKMAAATTRATHKTTQQSVPSSVTQHSAAVTKIPSKVVHPVQVQRSTSKLVPLRKNFSFLPRYHKSSSVSVLENDSLIDMVSNLAHIS
eukprot:c6709_g1_i1.p1 GENE.c6709_g1_i1~~c6709_g1_i1.p1  ORF type:complete len:185 (-),score=24.56 c6709_g1_i1:71-625(-)